MRRISACLLLALLLGGGTPPRARADPPADGSTASDRFAPLEPPALEEGERTRLAAGGIVVRELVPSDEGGIGVLMMGVIDASPDRVWAVMSDCENQDEFMPRVSYAAVRDREGEAHTCELVVDMPFPLEDAHTLTRNHVRRLPDGGYQRRWELLPGHWSYLRNSGSWSVYPYGRGVSLLVSRMDLLPRSAIPIWIQRAGQARQASATFDAIRARVSDAPSVAAERGGASGRE